METAEASLWVSEKEAGKRKIFLCWFYSFFFFFKVFRYSLKDIGDFSNLFSYWLGSFACHTLCTQLLVALSEYLASPQLLYTCSLSWSPDLAAAVPLTCNQKGWEVVQKLDWTDEVSDCKPLREVWGIFSQLQGGVSWESNSEYWTARAV